jgi:hypothetical protein
MGSSIASAHVTTLIFVSASATTPRCFQAETLHTSLVEQEPGGDKCAPRKRANTRIGGLLLGEWTNREAAPDPSWDPGPRDLAGFGRISL